MTRINDNGIERDMTSSEKTQYNDTKQQIAADEQALENQIQTKLVAKESARAKLAALGLTEIEIDALVG